VIWEWEFDELWGLQQTAVSGTVCLCADSMYHFSQWHSVQKVFFVVSGKCPNVSARSFALL
jgi:hypothetical protein